MSEITTARLEGSGEQEIELDVRTQDVEINMGPQHPATHGVLRVLLRADGEVLTPVTRDDIAAAVEVMRREGVESVAVAFLHTYVNPANERAVRDLLAELAPDLPVTLSSDVLPQIKEYERTSTTVVNGYVKPLAQNYLNNLGKELGDTGYTAPLQQWNQTVITGLTTEPLVLTSWWSQTFRPQHHNFSEDFLFEPRLDPNVTQAQRDELDAADIRWIVGTWGYNEGIIVLVGADNTFREVGAQ